MDTYPGTWVCYSCGPGSYLGKESVRARPCPRGTTAATEVPPVTFCLSEQPSANPVTGPRSITVS